MGRGGKGVGETLPNAFFKAYSVNIIEPFPRSNCCKVSTSAGLHSGPVPDGWYAGAGPAVLLPPPADPCRLHCAPADGW